MKKVLLILGFLLVSLICMSQQQVQKIQQKANHSYNFNQRELYYVPLPDTIPLVNITPNQIEALNGWAIEGVPCQGCASYYYKILRSKTTHKAYDGVSYYYFYFYFYTNSYTNDGKLATTALKDITFFAEDNKNTFNVPYLLIEPKEIVYGAWMRSIDPLTPIGYHATNVTVF